MGKYSCEKCAKTFSQKSHYDKHLTRKNPCEIQTDKIKALIDKAVEEKLIELNKKLISNNIENNITINITEQMDISKMSKLELMEKCKELGITKCSSKNKSQLLELITSKQSIHNISNNDINASVENNKMTLQTDVLPQSDVLLQSDCKIINYIDLCCGIGGFRVALESFQKKNTNFKFNCVLSADIKDDAIRTYNLNFNENNKKTDILDIDEIGSGFDLLCAGFPCQPFSSAGQKKGFDDDRGGIIFKIIDICKKYKPRVVILENVSNLIILENGKPLKKICDEFKNIDYFVSYKKLNATDFGVPQNRERVFIVCSLEKQIDLDKIEHVNPDNTLNSIIDHSAKYTDIEPGFANKIMDLHSQTPLFGYKMQDKRGGQNNIHSWDIGVNGVLTMDERSLMNKIMTERRKKHWAEKKNIVWMDGMPLTLSEISTFVDDPNLKQMLDNLVAKNYLRLEKPKNLISGKRVYDETGELGYNICKGKLSFPITNILDPTATSPTLTATDSNKLAVIIDNTFIRKLNDNELKLLCGFPLSYKLPVDVDKYDLFGNMVIPNVVEGVLKCVF
jgi:DNA (cytosine-5)-methyltransferase 1